MSTHFVCIKQGTLQGWYLNQKGRLKKGYFLALFPTTHVQELINNLPETAGLELSIPRFRLGLRSSKLCRLRDELAMSGEVPVSPQELQQVKQMTCWQIADWEFEKLENVQDFVELTGCQVKPSIAKLLWEFHRQDREMRSAALTIWSDARELGLLTPELEKALQQFFPNHM